MIQTDLLFMAVLVAALYLARWELARLRHP